MNGKGADRGVEFVVAKGAPPAAAKRITSLANPVVKEIRGLALAKNRKASGLFVAEGLKLVADAVGLPPDRGRLVYQSRSGRPQDPWLEPDILDHIRTLHAQGVRALTIAPIGFLSDHMEVLYDLDEEARLLCGQLELPLTRARTVDTHPAFVRMIRDLIVERGSPETERPFLGTHGASHAVCPPGCCLSGAAKPAESTERQARARSA